MECRVTKSFFSFSVDSARLCGNFCPSVGPGLEGSLAGDKGVHGKRVMEREGKGEGQLESSNCCDIDYNVGDK